MRVSQTSVARGGIHTNGTVFVHKLRCALWSVMFTCLYTIFHCIGAVDANASSGKCYQWQSHSDTPQLHAFHKFHSNTPSLSAPASLVTCSLSYVILLAFCINVAFPIWECTIMCKLHTPIYCSDIPLAAKWTSLRTLKRPLSVRKIFHVSLVPNMLNLIIWRHNI